VSRESKPGMAESQLSDGLKIIRDHVLAYRMRQLPRTRMAMAWYHGASPLEMWTGDEFSQFGQAIAQAAEDGIVVKRFFVFKERKTGNAGSEELRTLRQHAEISHRKPTYQWRAILKDDICKYLGAHTFALFSDSADAQVEVWRDDNGKFGFSESTAEAAELEAAFEELWNKDGGPSSSVEPLVILNMIPEGERDAKLKKYREELQDKLQDSLRESLMKVLKADDVESILRSSNRRDDKMRSENCDASGRAPHEDAGGVANASR
jgi:hypothetical protein